MAKPSYSASSKVGLDISVTRVAQSGATAVYEGVGQNATTNLELATFHAAGDLYHGYVDATASKTVERDDKLTENDDWAVYKIVVKSKGDTIDGQSYDHTQVAALLHGTSMTVKVDSKNDVWTEITAENTKAASATDYYSLSGGIYTKETVEVGTTVVTGMHTLAQSDSRARLWVSATNTSTVPALSAADLDAAGGTTKTLANAISIDKTTIDGTGYIYYVAFYVEGHGFTDGDAATITQGIHVSVY